MITWMSPHLIMDIRDYHSHHGISKSKLDSIAKSPLHYWSRWCDPSRVTPAPTPAMEFGTAVHMAVLEPGRFAYEYTQAPDVARTTKAGKAEWEAAAADGKQLLKKDDWHSIQAIRQAIATHPMASKILEASGRSERSLFGTCSRTGLELKCRPDYLTDSGWIVDLKTTKDASARAFQKSAATYRYHVQAAHYLHVCELVLQERLKGFLFIAVESGHPHAVQVFEASPTFVQVGAAEAMRNLDALAHALDTYPSDKPWPSYSDDVMRLDPPTWLTPQLPEM